MSGGTLKAGMAALLVVSLSLKLAVFRSDPSSAVAPLPPETPLVLAENGFDAIRELDEGRMVSARRGDCEVLLARVTADGSQVEAMRRLAPPGASISSLDEGEPATGASFWGTVIRLATSRLKFYFGTREDAARHLMIIQTAACPSSILGLERLR